MKIKVGNQTFDSEKVPVAIIMDEKERFLIMNRNPKPDGELHLFTLWPGDIPVNVVLNWLLEAAPEIEMKQLQIQLTKLGKIEKPKKQE